MTRLSSSFVRDRESILVEASMSGVIEVEVRIAMMPILRSGVDTPKAQIEGLMHVGTHARALGYRPAARN